MLLGIIVPPPKYEIKRSKWTPASVRNAAAAKYLKMIVMLKYEGYRTESDLTNAPPIAILLPLQILLVVSALSRSNISLNPSTITVFFYRTLLSGK
jgi:hypothetical protein